jgi:hypothetical protein
MPSLTESRDSALSDLSVLTGGRTAAANVCTGPATSLATDPTAHQANATALAAADAAGSLRPAVAPKLKPIRRTTLTEITAVAALAAS